MIMSYLLPKASKSLSLIPALACVHEMTRNGGNVDLTAEDYEFLCKDELWLYNEQSRVRRVVEAAAYGGLDIIGFPRFPLPAEFLAAVVATMVAPCNRLAACRILEGTSSVVNTLNGVDEQVNARQLFAHVCAISAENYQYVHGAEHLKRRQFPLEPLEQE